MWRRLTAWGQKLEHGDTNLNAYSEAILQRIRRLMKTVYANHGELFSRWTKGLLYILYLYCSFWYTSKASEQSDFYSIWTEASFCRAFVLLSLTVFCLGAMKIKASAKEMVLVLFHNFDFPEEMTLRRPRYERFYNERKSKSETTLCEHAGRELRELRFNKSRKIRRPVRQNIKSEFTVCQPVSLIRISQSCWRNMR